jgi:hypothetical protein
MARTVTLIVEDGTVVADSNSFVSEQEVVDSAAMRGVTLPFSTDEDKDKVAILAIKAADYLRIMPWKGEVVESTQTMPWPRKNIGSTPSFPEDEVPLSVIEAQQQLVLLVNAGTILVPTSTGTGYLIKEKIGPIENVYSEKVGVSSDGLPLFPGIKALLYPWILGDSDGLVPVMILSVGGSDAC